MDSNNQQKQQTDQNQNISIDNALARIGSLSGLEGIDLSTTAGFNHTGPLGMGLDLPQDLMASLTANTQMPLTGDPFASLGLAGLNGYKHDALNNLNGNTVSTTANNLTNPMSSTEQLLQSTDQLKTENMTPDLNLSTMQNQDLNQLLASLTTPATAAQQVPNHATDISSLTNMPQDLHLNQAPALNFSNTLLNNQLGNPMGQLQGGLSSGFPGINLNPMTGLSNAFSRQPAPFVPGSSAHRAQFHQKGPDYEIKLFVGGLAYQTQESDLIQFFKQHGHVADAIVMRDQVTGKGRGFGFVKMQFENRDKAQSNKFRLIEINNDRTKEGHMINDKRVDVKSADDYVKPPPGQPGVPQTRMNQGMGGMPSFNPMAGMGMGMGGGMPPSQMLGMAPPVQKSPLDTGPLINKPNPYVIVETKDEDNINKDKKEVVFKYPKSKIFVGGLDFRLENKDLIQHFSQYGDIESAVILKDINSGTSRGFGFVTFKDEEVAQNLIKNMQTTNIGGRKVDIKSAEPKQQNNMNAGDQPRDYIKRIPQYGQNQGGQPKGYAMIPQYGGEGGNRRNHQQYNDYENESGGGSSRGNDSFYKDQYRRGNPPPYNRQPNDHPADRDNRRKGRDREEHHHRSDRDGRRNRRGYHRYSPSRSDSGDSRGSSSSYQKGRDHRRSRRDKDSRRGPHHGPKPVENQQKEKKNNSSQNSENIKRSRSR